MANDCLLFGPRPLRRGHGCARQACIHVSSDLACDQHEHEHERCGEHVWAARTVSTVGGSCIHDLDGVSLECTHAHGVMWRSYLVHVLRWVGAGAGRDTTREHVDGRGDARQSHELTTRLSQGEEQEVVRHMDAGADRRGRWLVDLARSEHAPRRAKAVKDSHPPLGFGSVSEGDTRVWKSVVDSFVVESRPRCTIHPWSHSMVTSTCRGFCSSDLASTLA